MKLTLTQICKGELENLKRIYPLIKDHIDEWVVVIPPGDSAKKFLSDKAVVIEKDFTQAIEPGVLASMRQEYGLEVPDDYRLFNFAAARNASLEAATGDYCVWFDGDDEPLGLDNIKQFVAQNHETEIFDAVYDYFRDEEGNSISDHVRERVWVNNGKFEWKGGKLGLIHETLLPKEGYNPLRLDIPEEIFRVQHETDHVDASSMRNHIALLYEYIVTNAEDPRTIYYLGVEFFNRKMYDQSIRFLREYVTVGGWDEERYHAYLKIAEAYQMMGDYKSSRNAYLKAIEEMPHYPHAYLGIGESYHHEQNYAKAIEFMITGLQKKLPKTKYVNDMTRMTFRPAVFIALDYLQLGKPKEAYEWFLKAVKMNPNHPWVKEYVGLFADAKDLNDYVRSFVRLGQISQRLYPKMLGKLAEAIPDELKDQELLMDFKWRYTTPKIWSNNSIVFFCSSAFEDWGPESLKKGCGGSEEAIIQLSKRLTGLGWDVTVFNNCAKEGTFDGVKWVRFERFNPRDIFNALVSWRNNIFVDPRVATHKLIDLHDVPGTNYYTEDVLKGVKMMVKSQYHRSLLPGLGDEYFKIVPNGVDPAQFNRAAKTKNNLVWTSSYDRGLEYLLEMWPDLLEVAPDITLDVYYGFDLFDTTPWGMTQNGRVWKAKMLKLLSQKGVTEHGRVGSDEVAVAYLKADIWAYPTEFPEISCITAIKAQLARCRVLTSGFAALEETIQRPEEKLDMTKPEERQKFKAKLIELLKAERNESTLNEIAHEVAKKYNWDEVAKQWDEVLRENRSSDSLL